MPLSPTSDEPCCGPFSLTCSSGRGLHLPTPSGVPRRRWPLAEGVAPIPYNGPGVPASEATPVTPVG